MDSWDLSRRQLLTSLFELMKYGTNGITILTARRPRGAQSQELRMEFLKGETEARYAWDTAAKVARQESECASRMAALHRTMQESRVNVLRDFRTIRGALTATQPAHVMGRFARHPQPWESPDYFPHSAHAAKLAHDAGWRPKPSLHSAAPYADYLAGTAYSSPTAYY
jgi:hypothetical protein